MIKNKIIAELNFIISGGNQSYMSAVIEINNHFLSLMQPKNLDGGNANNVIVQFQVHFAELCIALQTNGIVEPKSMTVFEFYAALKYFDDRKRKQQPPR